MKTLLLFPNQLFNINVLKNMLKNVVKENQTINILLYEHPKYFQEYNYHKSKLVFHRATMCAYFDMLKTKNFNIKYIEYNEKINIKTDIIIIDPTDFDVLDNIEKYTKKHKLNLEILESPLFIFSKSDLDEYIKTTDKPYFNTTFYKWARQYKNILMNNNKPYGGKWSFDTENRLPFEKSYKEKEIKFIENSYIKEATQYIEKNFLNNPGNINIFLPINHKDAEKYYDIFLKDRLKNFGSYEDAISPDVMIGYHSGISALLNIGLLNPLDVIEKAVEKKSSIKIQSIEGFIRQILSWREYVRFLYINEHKKFNKMNFLNHNHKLKKVWYTGETKITPVDNVIKKALNISYAHHIERLMIIGNFMLLMMIKPKDVLKWFLEIISIDAYEWVMEPNVYGMSQHSVGQLMMNRPYFSSSNYIFKMSTYKKSHQYEKIILENIEYEWYEIWDALYYNFINVHKTYLKSIYATANAVFILNKKTETEKKKLFKLAKLYMDKY
jgi:deoxyribodipyrimidine photolyase-related protein